MATTLEEFPGGSGRKSIYDWEKLLNGQVWQAEQGTKEEFKAGTKDYAVSGKSFRSAAQQAAERKSGKVETRILDGGSRVVLKFVRDAEKTVTETPDDAA